MLLLLLVSAALLIGVNRVSRNGSMYEVSLNSQTGNAEEKGDRKQIRAELMKKTRASDDFNKAYAVPWKKDIEAYLKGHPEDEELKKLWDLYGKYQNYVYHIRDIDQKTAEEYQKILGTRNGSEAELTESQKEYIQALNEEYLNRANKKWPLTQFKI